MVYEPPKPGENYAQQTWKKAEDSYCPLEEECLCEAPIDLGKSKHETFNKRNYLNKCDSAKNIKPTIISTSDRVKALNERVNQKISSWRKD